MFKPCLEIDWLKAKQDKTFQNDLASLTLQIMHE